VTTLLAAGATMAIGLLATAMCLRADGAVLRRMGPTARREPSSPGRWDRGRWARRPRHGRDLASGVPDLIDLVAVAVSAGLTPRLALDRATSVVGGALGVELDGCARSVALGRPWRIALRDLAERSGIADLRRLAVTLDRGERLGSPLAAQLRELARQARVSQRIRQEDRARRAPVAMLFPLVFCILPAFVLAAVVPAVVSAARGL